MEDEVNKRVLVPLNQICEKPWWLIISFLLMNSIAVMFINMKLFPSGILMPIVKGTSGLIGQTLMANLIMIAGIVIGLLMLIGGLKPMEVGLRGDKLGRALALTAVTWVALQLINAILSTFIPGMSLLSDAWTEFGATVMIGRLAGQLLGNALYEEIVFRGFFMVQMIKKMKRTGRPLYLGIAISQIIFALMHIPNRIMYGASFGEIIRSMLFLTALGVLFSFLYLYTNNLFLVVGLHALLNTPTPIFNGPATTMILAAFMIALAWFWPVLFHEKPLVPLKILETDRLILRPWTMEDGKDMYEYAKDPMVGPSAGWAPHKSQRESEEIIRHFQQDNDVFAIEWKATGKVIGSIGVHERYPSTDYRNYKQREIGYVLNPAFWGQGIMPEAVERIKNYCWEELELEIIWCGHFEDNSKSRRVIEKTGFIYAFTKETTLQRLNNRKTKTLFYKTDNR